MLDIDLQSWIYFFARHPVYYILEYLSQGILEGKGWLWFKLERFEMRICIYPFIHSSPFILFKFSNQEIGTIYEACSKLMIKSPQWLKCRLSAVFNAYVEQVFFT